MVDRESDTVFNLGDKVEAVLERADLLTLEISVMPLKDIF